MQRIQRLRRRGWRKPDNTIYVGKPSKWGNPFDWQTIGRSAAVEQYRQSLDAMQHEELWRYLQPLRGADFLMCWCPLSEPCHADVLIEFLDRPEIRLNPCPFCNGLPTMTRIGNEYHKKIKIMVRCPQCRIERTDAALRYDFAWLTDVAIRNWNQRPNITQGEDNATNNLK